VSQYRLVAARQALCSINLQSFCSGRGLASPLNCGADELPRRSPNLEPPRNCALCCRMTHHILWQWVCYSRLRNRRKNRPIKPEVAIEMPKNLDKMGPWLHYREVCNVYLGA
jgi:hypothetical protein